MNTSSCCYSARTQLLPYSSSSPSSSLISIPKSSYRCSSIPSQHGVTRKLGSLSSRRRLPLAAAVVGTSEELERELEEWVVGINNDGRCSCVEGGEISNIVEVMECLEREAIMGGDEGREAADYYRRAHLFDNSSRLFQALKDTTTTNHPHPTTTAVLDQ